MLFSKWIIQSCRCHIIQRRNVNKGRSTYQLSVYMINQGFKHATEKFVSKVIQSRQLQKTNMRGNISNPTVGISTCQI